LLELNVGQGYIATFFETAIDALGSESVNSRSAEDNADMVALLKTS
jgi:hypothetical protein